MYKGVTMTKVMNRVIDDIQELSQDEKNKASVKKKKTE